MSVSRKTKSVHDQEGGADVGSGQEEPEEEAEPGDDETEAESFEEEQEADLHDGYAFRQGRIYIKMSCHNRSIFFIMVLVLMSNQ